MNKVNQLRYLVIPVFILAILFSSISCGPTKYDLNTSVNINGGGSVTPSSGSYEKDVEVNLVAQPAQGYRFDYWSGSVNGTFNPISFIMDEAKTITANFKAQYAISISTSPDKGGTVKPSQSIYDEGATVELTAIPEPGYEFDRWSGDVEGNTNPITFIVDKAKKITAHFKALLSVISNPHWGGTISPNGGYFDAGAQVNLLAQPAEGYRFEHWSGDIPGDSQNINPIVITMDSSKNIICNFVILQYKLTTTVIPSEGGIITPDNGSTINAGNQVFTAKPAAGYVFYYWSGDITGTTNPVTVAVQDNMSVNAYFKMYFSPLLSPVCQGKGVVQAADIHGDIHPIVLLKPNGNEAIDGLLNSKGNWAELYPEKWLPESVEETQLVATVSNEYFKVVDSETYINIFTGATTTVKRIQYCLDVILRQAKTGKEVARTTICGSVPPPFPERISGNIVAGTHVDFEDVVNWLQKYVESGS
jgi:hypothetical protein